MRLKPLALACLLGSCPLLSLAQTDDGVRVVKPKKEVKPSESAQIDTEKFQLGAYIGYLSVQDFHPSTLLGISFSYIINENFMANISYGATEVGLSTFEKFDGLPRLTDSQREVTVTSLSAFYKLFTSRSFLGSKHKYDSDIYLTAGVNQFEFAGQSNNGLTLGASYRVVFTDWLVVNFDTKDHIVDSQNPLTQTGSDTTHNLEFSIGVNALF